MSSQIQHEPMNYKKRFTPEDKKRVENDNDPGHIRNKCYTTTNDHSAPSIDFVTARESNNCAYILRKRFRMIDSWIILRFSEETIFINGKNLRKLYNDICRHKVTSVFIADYKEEDSEEPYVDYIGLKLNSDSEAKLDELPKLPTK